MNLPTEYVIQKFYQYAGFPKHKKLANVYEASCPICREGKSWGRKKRLYYLIRDNSICCHNCGWYSKPLKWIQEVSQLTYDEIVSESKDFHLVDISNGKDEELPTRVNNESLPVDSINILSEQEDIFWKNQPIVQEAIRFAQGRRLVKAVNRPKALYISLTDYIHKNRLVIPFFDEHNKIVHYQSRAIYEKDMVDRPKYLSKVNSDKTLFNINNIDPDKDDIFILEGPIDSFFLKNSVAVAGIQENSDNTFSGKQLDQIRRYSIFKKIWVLDSQWADTASMRKTRRLIELGNDVFIWPKDIGQTFKDLNDLCVKYNLNEIAPEFILKNTYSGLKAKLRLGLS